MLSHQQINELSIHLPVNFVGFREFGELKIYKRHLPHWRQIGATYFVTFRQADSIPKDVAQKLREDQEHWKRRLDSQENPPLEFKLAYDAFLKKHQRIVETSLDDCHGFCLFSNSENRSILESALNHFEGARYELSSFVIMPNHCHLVIRPHDGFALEQIIGSWKNFTSRRIAHPKGSLWKDESHDRILRDEDHFRKAVRYILKNPLKANLERSQFSFLLAGTDLTALESHLTHKR